MKQDKFMETKKAILEALEDKPKFSIKALVPAFYALSILGIGISILSQNLSKEGEEE